MTLTESIGDWVVDGEGMHSGAASRVVVTAELFAHLAQEQDRKSHSPAELEMCNRLRWYGLDPDPALAGSRR